MTLNCSPQTTFRLWRMLQCHIIAPNWYTFIVFSLRFDCNPISYIVKCCLERFVHHKGYHVEHNPSVILIRQLGIWDLTKIFMRIIQDKDILRPHASHQVHTIQYNLQVVLSVFMLVLEKPIKYFVIYWFLVCIYVFYLNIQTCL